MASPAVHVAAKAPLAPSPAHTHEHNLDQCDNLPKKNGSLKDSPSSNNLSASLLSARIVANALRPFYGKARDASNETSSSRQSGLDILNNLNIHDNEIAHQLVKLAEQQHNDMGDGTKTAVILAGSILDAATRLLESPETNENSTHISPSQIASSFVDAADYAVKVLSAHSEQADITNPEILSTLCQHHLTSSAIGNDPHAKIISTLTVDAILELDRQSGEEDCLPDLDRLHCVQEISGDVLTDSEVFSGLILKRPESGVGGSKSISNNPQVASSAVSVVTSTTEAAPKSLEGDVKVAILEYWLSPSSAELPDYGDEAVREEILREDRRRLLNDCKQIKKSGAKVVLIAAKESACQDEEDEKSEGEGSDEIIDVNLHICRHFLAKMGIMAISGLDAHQINVAINSLGGILIPFPENISLQELGSANKANEVRAPSGSSWIHFEGTRTPAATIMLHGPNNASLEDSKRTIKTILSLVENLFRDPHVVAGGGAAEIEASLRLRIQSTASTDHVESQCMRAFADALEVIPYTLAENFDINPAAVVTALRRQHAEGQTAAGLDVGDVGGIHDMVDAGIVNTLTAQVSAIHLATTFACGVLEKSKEV